MNSNKKDDSHSGQNTDHPHSRPPILWLLVPVALLVGAFLAAR